jgi:tetratricopeptide (TPR) repeat protein
MAVSVEQGTAVDFTARSDRLGRYLGKYAEGFGFDAFSDDFLRRNGIPFLRDVPIPLSAGDHDVFSSRGCMPIARIAGNMARVIGASPSFPHVKPYIDFLRLSMGEGAASAIAGEAGNVAERGSYDEACILFRAALCMEPRNLAAMYGYARVCRDVYLAGGDDGDYVGRFKAEAFEYFEMTAEAYPDFPPALYYLGYAYLNMGLYMKAYLTWKSYLGLSPDSDERPEIEERMRQLADPIEIEQGFNAVLAGRFDEGLAVLTPYSESKYSSGWLIWYYLGLACAGLGRRDEAADMFRRALALNPSHVESMGELADIYGIMGEMALSEKYRKKADLIRGGGYQREG